MKLKTKALSLLFISFLFYLAVPVLVFLYSWKLGLACAGLLLVSRCLGELAALVQKAGK
jgi:hypothetical protein